jgi:SAM-dependent methyltransferase
VETTSEEHVAREIALGNDWYTSSQFEWARKPGIRRIYAARKKFIEECIGRALKAKQAPLKMLDAGCGDGFWLHQLSGMKGVEFTGLDYNPLRLERAKCAAPNARILKGDLVSLDVNDTYDIILFSQVLEHIPDDLAALTQLKSRLKDNGILIVGVPNEGSRFHQWRIRRLGKAFKTDHVHFYREADIRGKLDQAGLAVGHVFRELLFLPNEALVYKLSASQVGFGVMTIGSKLLPSECAGFYFECHPKA